MFERAHDGSAFFFDRLSASEYEIYSRCNFPVTLATGKAVARRVDLARKKVLEPGGNSGGLAAALVTAYPDCRYTVVDRPIPCAVGAELCAARGLDVTFCAGDIFALDLGGERYDVVILMNLLHDFDDAKCLEILRGCTASCAPHTKFLILEDILTGELAPKEAVMHGLRLAVSCSGGRQRTAAEFAALFSALGWRLETPVRLSPVHTMLVVGRGG